MAKQKAKIRLDKKTKKEYARQVKNTRAKMNDVKKRFGVDLANEVQIPKLKDFEDRDDFNAWIKDVKDFRSRKNLDYQYVKNQHEVVATKAEIKKGLEDTRIAQETAQKLASEAENMPFISGGKVQGTVGQRRKMEHKPTTAGIVIPEDFKFEDIKSRKHLLKKLGNMEERSQPDFFDKRMTRMQNNFMDIITMSTNSLAEPLVERLEKLSPLDFYEMYLMFDEFSFELFASEGQPVETVAKETGTIKKMMMYLDEWEEGNVNKDMTGLFN